MMRAVRMSENDAMVGSGAACSLALRVGMTGAMTMTMTMIMILGDVGNASGR